ncbi:TRAP transporter large permease subunit [Clostridium sp. HMP27]|uniref:TRAP transporter large permease subunit n=1 Tax=Clostridium sp. HMP27 TaxID=1487921 RepID=UPI00052C8490|nr:TRAP transporter large permease subunit [Clostridium sp. HMP27]KGK89985.1 C4-dicarboxylate ABC transporter permease [Clostridium sp. HMP27]
MELGKYALISAPSLIALLPLLAYLIMVFRNKSNLSGLIIGVIVAAILTGQGVKSLAGIFVTSLGSFLAIIGIIIMCGSGLGYLMNKTKVSQTLVYWIVKGIGVNTEKKGMAAVIISSIVICGLLGTLAGGNAIIAPVIIPVVAAVGLTPSTVCALFKVAGEVGLIMGPLTGVTIATMGITGLSYGKLMLWAVIPFSIVWIGATVFAANKIQKKLKGVEVYEITEDMIDINKMVVSIEQKRTTILFLIVFAILVGYGVVTKQGTNYAIIVMLILSAILTISSRIEIDSAIDTFVEGASKMTNMFFVFIFFEVMFSMINIGGGFDALGKLLTGLVAGGGKAGVLIIASLVGGFGIEAAAVAEITIVHKMFIDLVNSVGLPMQIWATAILAATRITGSLYPTANLAGQLGIARCSNTKTVLKATWVGAAALWIWVMVWAFIGPILAG